MFGKKNKNSPPKQPEMILHPEMGELIFHSFWHGKTESSIFGNVLPMDLCVYVDEDKDNLSVQEQSFRFYISNVESINSEITRELYKAYDLDDSFDLGSRFTPEALIILWDGNCGISFRDKTEPEGISSELNVVTILPKVEFFGSEDDYC